MADGSVLPEGLLGVGSGSPSSVSDTTPVAPVETELQTPTPAEGSEGAATPPAPNWDDPSNPYLVRFQGLQGTVQREVETRRQLEERLRQLEDERIERSLAHLDPATRQARMQEYRRAQDLEAREAALEEERRVNAQASKAIIMMRLSQEYGVPQEELEDFDHPEPMVKYAKKVKALRESLQQTVQQQVRTETRADEFEPVHRSAPAPLQQASDLRGAADSFVSDPRISSRYR
jgi:hypothetical protein